MVHKSTVPIVLDDVVCVGNEESLSQCSHRGIGVHNCHRSEDVAITCQCTNGDIRLVDGSNSDEGRVEYCNNGVWGTVCGDLWDRNNTLVVCRQNGLPTNCE